MRKTKLISIGVTIALSLVMLFTSCTGNVGDKETETSKPSETASQNENRPSQTVRVVSYNLSAEEATIKDRAEGLTSIILGLEPDSFGVQEARGSWVEMLDKYCSEKYGRVGCDAGGNENGSYQYFATFIFYRLDKYKVIDSGTFWMSKTPDVPSKYSDTVDCNRTCTWAILEDINTGFRYVHMNLHLDWMDMKVNLVQIKMIAEQMTYFEKLGYPVLSTGDYNAEEGSDSYNAITSYENIGDPKFLAEKTMDLGTYPEYDNYDVTVDPPIDFCFITKNLFEKVYEYRVITDKYNGEYVSDHYGIMVEAKVKELPKIDETLSIPSFAENAVTAEYDGKNINIKFEAATDSTGKAAKRYVVEVTAEGSTSTYSKKLWGKMHIITEIKAQTFKYTPKTSNIFEVKITPYDLFDNAGNAFTIKVDARQPEDTDDGVVPVADLFDLGFTGTDVEDKSSSNLKITKYGKPTIDADSISFNGNSNLNMKTFSKFIDKLDDGFTQELEFSVSDSNGDQGLFACMHAGGFGFYVEGGTLIYYLRIDNDYITLQYDIEDNKVYHVFATYDTKSVILYVDGQEVDSAETDGTFAHPTVASATFLCLGADSDASGSGENRSYSTVYTAKLYSDPISAVKIAKLSD